MSEKEYKTEQEFLKEYNSDKYKKPSVTVDMLIFTIGEKEASSYRELPTKKLEILMIKRNGHPYKDCWAIPGGFIDVDNESLIDSARRELKEETNLENIYMEQLYTWGDLNRDPRGRVISTSYMALAQKSKLDGVVAGDDAKEAEWFAVSLEKTSENNDFDKNGAIICNTTILNLTLENENIGVKLDAKIKVVKNIKGNTVDTTYELVENDGIAFDHAKIISYAVSRLRNKLEYTTIAFQLIDEEFTIGELQLVYSTILDKQYTAPNFRRKMSPMLIPVTNPKKTENKGHRPAQYYRLNPINNIQGGF